MNVNPLFQPSNTQENIMIDVVIVEDDIEIRNSMAILLNGTAGFKCERSYGSCEEAIPQICADVPDVVLMDISLPGISGIEGVQRLKVKLPELNIIMLTIHSDKEKVFQALCAGACGYLLKDMSPAKLLESIRDIAGGGAPMSSQIARMVVESFKVKQSEVLTPREKEVLGELCQGKSYRSIATTLFISEETVRQHIKHIYKKLEVSSKSEAVAKAFREKLVSGLI